MATWDFANLVWFFAEPIICGVFIAFVWIGGGLASVMIIYAGLKYLTSSDDPGARKNAKEMIMHALIAIIIIVVGTTIVDVISGGDIIGCVLPVIP